MSLTDTPMRILVMAGGTGGHVFPALSIARYLRAEGVSVEWLGTRRGLEARVVPAEGIRLNEIRIGGLRGKGLLRRLLAPFVIVGAILQSCVCLLRFRPHCVLGMGGFATGPGGIAAWLMRKPLLIHEQNAIAGFTNLMLMPFARIVMEAFPGAFVKKRELDDNWLSRWASRRADAIQVVGNPVREDIAHLPETDTDRDPGPLRILVVGGSLGAKAINEVIPQAIAGMEADSRPMLWHQCGDRHLDDTIQAYCASGLEAGREIRIERFIEDMAVAYNWADLVICRAGALTVCELASAGRASILIPYPHGVDDHQTENARFLTEAGAGILVPEETLDATRLGELLVSLVADPQQVETMARHARALARHDATEVVGKLCMGVCNG